MIKIERIPFKGEKFKFLLWEEKHDRNVILFSEWWKKNLLLPILYHGISVCFMKAGVLYYIGEWAYPLHPNKSNPQRHQNKRQKNNSKGEEQYKEAQKRNILKMNEYISSHFIAVSIS